MGLGEIIRTRREKLVLTQDQLSQRAGISKPYLSNIETGKAKNPPSDAVLRRLEKAMFFSPGELMRLAHLSRVPVDVRQEHELLEAEVQRLRLALRELIQRGGQVSSADVQQLLRRIRPDAASRLSAGLAVPVLNKPGEPYPRSLGDLDYPPAAQEYVRCPDVHDVQAFAVHVAGDAMAPAYLPGDIVVFSPNTPARQGDDCFVRLAGDGDTDFARYYRDDEHVIRLQPLNTAFPPRVLAAEQVTALWPAVVRIHRIRR